MSSERCPLVSIIHLNYNGKKFVDLWASLFKVDYPNFEIIFVDNGSRDGSIDMFKALVPKNWDKRIEYVIIDNNVGYSKGNNIGIEHSKGDYYVLLSNDIEVEINWLKEMINFLESNKDIGVAQSMMFSIFNKAMPDKMGNDIDVLGFNYGFVPTGQVKEVFYSEGAVMFIRRKVLDEVGYLFDSNYFMFFEDVDFCWRVRLCGYRIVVVPTSVVYHVRGGTVPGILMKTDPFYAITNTRNRLITLFKNYDSPRMLLYVSLCCLIELGEGCWLKVKGKEAVGKGCIIGVWEFLKYIPRETKKRKEVQSTRKLTDKQIVTNIFNLRRSLNNLMSSAKELDSSINDSKIKI